MKLFGPFYTICAEYVVVPERSIPLSDLDGGRDNELALRFETLVHCASGTPKASKSCI